MATQYVEERDGWLYVAGTRISLASVIYGLRREESPETIQWSYSSLTLDQVHGAIEYIRTHPEEVEAYLKRHEERWDEIRRTYPSVEDHLKERRAADKAVPVSQPQ